MFGVQRTLIQIPEAHLHIQTDIHCFPISLMQDIIIFARDLAILVIHSFSFFQLPVEAYKDSPEPKVQNDPDDETNETDDITDSIGRTEFLVPEVGAGNVTELRDGVEKSDTDCSFGRWTRE